MNATNGAAVNTKLIKAALIGLTGEKRIKVRAGKGSHKNGVLIYLPKSIRCPGRLPEVASFMETYFGRVDFMKSFPAPGTYGVQKPYFSVQPLFEES